MSRRELILVAVLINTGLLITLFVTALKPSSGMETVSALAVKEEKQLPLPVVEKTDKGYDPVDSLLSQYVKDESKQTPDKNSIKDANLMKPAQVESQSAGSKAMSGQIQGPSSVKEVIVKQGDVLEKIARAHQTSVEEIMNLNQMQDTRLRIGQILYVPGEGAKRSKSPPQKSSQFTDTRGDPTYYTVKNGDSPWTIAIKNHMKVEELLRLNQLDERKAKQLKPGDRLRIR